MNTKQIIINILQATAVTIILSLTALTPLLHARGGGGGHGSSGGTYHSGTAHSGATHRDPQRGDIRGGEYNRPGARWVGAASIATGVAVGEAVAHDNDDYDGSSNEDGSNNLDSWDDAVEEND